MAEKPKKPQKLKARLPRGLEDRGPAAINATRQMVEKIRAVYELYGFEPVETPAMEYTDALGKFLPDQDRPNEGVFSFQDDDEQWISLRYDLTAPLARYVAENFDHLPKPYRSYRFGYVFRNEKPGPGRFRQFMQFDADTVGSATPAADAEICMMAADTMEALGIPRGAYVVKVNNRKVLDGVLEAIGLGDDAAAQKLTVLRAIDKLDRLGMGEVARLLGPGRVDESGDITAGANLSDEQIGIILTYVNGGDLTTVNFASRDRIRERPMVSVSVHIREDEPGDGYLSSDYDNVERVERLRRALPNNARYLAGLDELADIARLCQSSSYSKSQISIDPSVVRGLEYYTGPVYEVELLLDTKDEKGRPVRFGSVGGGGRYDGLVSRFRGEPVPATGFSIGVSRLQAALTMLGKLDTRAEFGPVVVTVFDRDRVADYQQMVARLRSANIRAELYLGNPKNMGNQLKYADRRNSPCVIIQGSDEKARGEVQIKDLIEGAKAAAAIASNQEWRETRPAQFSCAEADLVARVREVLARHDVTWG
ncbi:histidine--tRNA ligase [Bradyrhizobium sp. ORS 86]|uniref:histidine--tRNA ligase n=1 Tax=Bradyrhizobium sp. ORS 86 TaxID=1685970 RepID=UPI0038900B17